MTADVTFFEYVAEPVCEHPVTEVGRLWAYDGDGRAVGSVDVQVLAMQATHCTVPGCTRPVRARGLCGAHYQRLQTFGDVMPDVPVGWKRQTPTDRPTCEVPGCTRGGEASTTKTGNPTWRKVCAAHRKRQHRGTDLDAPVPEVGPRGEGSITSYGYRRVYLPEHDIAQVDGYILEHRAVAYDVYGPGPHSCHWCSTVLADWPDIEVDHHDGERLNNDPSNLLLACSDCNKARARAGNPTEWSPA